MRVSASERFAGRELSVLEGLGIQSNPRKNKPCPACGGKDRFTLSSEGKHYCRKCGHGDFLSLIQKVYRVDFKAALRMAEDSSGIGRRYSPPNMVAIPRRERPTVSSEFLDKLWQAALPLEQGDPAQKYLENRAIKLTKFPSVLRHHKSLPYWDEDGVKTGEYPALLAAVQALTGEVVCIHRTYLMPGGSPAPVPMRKKQTAPVSHAALKGAAVRLYVPNDELALAEGIETALSYSQLHGVPAWAGLNAWGLEEIEIPNAIRKIHVCVDNDEAGRKAAERLKARFESKRITVITKPLPGWLANQKGADWNDVLTELNL